MPLLDAGGLGGGAGRGGEQGADLPPCLLVALLTSTQHVLFLSPAVLDGSLGGQGSHTMEMPWDGLT